MAFSQYSECAASRSSATAPPASRSKPRNEPHHLWFQIQTLIVQLKRAHSSRGAPKNCEKIRRLHNDIQLPAISTVHAVLDRHRLVTRGRPALCSSDDKGEI